MAPHTSRALFACALFVLAAESAAAECTGPSNELEWSYPNDGQVDVPPNAGLFLLPPASSVRLNGTELVKVAEALWEPGELTPGESYLVEYTMPPSPDTGVARTGSFTFEVGSVPVEPVSVFASSLGELHPLEQGLSLCFVESDQDCSDDFPVAAWGADVRVPGVILWRSTSRNSPWQPATCEGAPAIDVGLDESGTYCDNLIAYGADGSSVTGINLCASVTLDAGPGQDAGPAQGGGEPRDTTSSGWSCASVGGGLSLLPLLAIRSRTQRKRRELAK